MPYSSISEDKDSDILKIMQKLVCFCSQRDLALRPATRRSLRNIQVDLIFRSLLRTFAKKIEMIC